MKKQIVLGLGLAVMATPALATRARLLALGEDANGSFYINDNRNIFLNSAEINNNKDLVTYEWGGASGQGGMTRSVGNMVYGLHLNNGSDYNTVNSDALSADATDPENLDKALNPNSIDLFVGGDVGIKWGANLTYVKGSDDAAVVGDDGAVTPVNVTADAKTSVMDLNVGVQAGDIKAFVNYGINGSSTYDDMTGNTGSNKINLDRDQDLKIGGSYQLNSYTIFGQYGMNKYTAKYDASKETQDNSFFQIGAGRQDKLNDKVTLFTKASYINFSSEYKATSKDTSKGWNVPVVIGLEAEAASWLAVRGSVSQDILSGNEDKTATTKNKYTNNSSTLVNVGSSLRFGEFTIDGVLSNNATGKITLDDVMSTVSMTYKF